VKEGSGNPEASQLTTIGFVSFTVRFCGKVVNWTGTKQKSKMKIFLRISYLSLIKEYQ